MKIIITTILLWGLPFIGQAQNAKITIGRGTDCFGRGACSISAEKSENYNATFIHNFNGTTLLRIFRNKLTKEEGDRVLGQSITSANVMILKFEMEEALILPENLKRFIPIVRSGQYYILRAGTYPTVITTAYIDITITAD